MSHHDSDVYYDTKYHANVHIVHPGEYYISSDPDIKIITILGSCVAACIFDSQKKIGGLNHFMLPSAPDPSDLTSRSNRYGSFAMEKLINELLKMGCRCENFEVKLFGGSNMIKSSAKIGDINIDFIHHYVSQESLRVISEDLGGMHARRIIFSPTSGKVMRLNLNHDDDKVVQEEKNYIKKVIPELVPGETELFSKLK